MVTRAGQAMGAAMAKGEEFAYSYLGWSMEGRDVRVCDCGRQFKALGWAKRHLRRSGHAPPEAFPDVYKEGRQVNG